MDDLRELLADARMRLSAVPREGLGAVLEPSRLRSAWGAQRRIVRVADVWRLGVLLLGDDALYATGEVMRAAEEVRRGYTAESQRRRAEIRGMAFRGGFVEGETFHIEWEQLDIDAIAAGSDGGPLLWSGGALLVSWSPGGAPRPFAGYLAEGVALLQDPPVGAA